MQNRPITIGLLTTFISFALSLQASDKYITNKTKVRFFSTTPIENIEATNYAAVSSFNTKTGEGVAVVPIQSFEFEKALMQEHFNGERYMNSKTYPTAKLKGKITNLKSINFKKDGKYPATITGEMTIKGKTNPVAQEGEIQVKGKEITVTGKFNLTLADYGVDVGPASPTAKIAQTVEVTVNAVYQPEE